MEEGSENDINPQNKLILPPQFEFFAGLPYLAIHFAD